jgi:plastocyanin
MPSFVRPGLARLLLAALVVLACPVSAADARVSIAAFAFGPQAINIEVGDSVTWSNNDGAPHTVNFKDGSVGAKSLSPADTFTRVFDQPGTYEYFCAFHPYMTGRVIVSAK